MKKYIAAIVGRPNVGKSTLFNFITGRRISIVEGTPGVTRDRIYAEAEWRGRRFSLIDTGGIEPYSPDTIMQQMRRQAEIAIDAADSIIFLVDAKEGITASDEEVADILRKSGKKIITVINKVDNPSNPPAGAYDFYKMAPGEILQISSAHGLGIGDLLDELYKDMPNDTDEDKEADSIKVAVIGKPNSGKSSLVNRMTGEYRMIVSDIPGTTRDAVDTTISVNGREYVFIDTAGIRKKSRILEDIEKYSIIRAWSAIDRSDVCLMLIDGQDGVTEQDTKIAGYAHEQGKASVIAVNKWDLVEKQTGTLESYKKSVLEKLSFMAYAPVAFISAKTGQRVDKLFGMITNAALQASMRISTGMLNDLVNESVALVQPPSDKGKRLRIFYAAQTGIKPPVFVFFVNNIQLVHFSYERYLENQLRKGFGFEGTPIRLLFRERSGDKA